jgi:hypothetical protein
MENQTILQRANLDWSVETRPLVTAGENPIETNHIAIVRADTNKILGVHSSGYEAFQNSQMGELLERISGKMDLPLHKGGYFGDGQKTYIQLKTSDKRLGTDLVKGYLTCVNSFDGSTSLGFGHSNLTISCQNTFFANYKQMENKVRHTASMMAKVDAICMQIEEVLRSEFAIFNKIEKMTQIEIDPKVREMVLQKMLNLQKEERLSDLSTLSTRKKNILSDLQVSITGEIYGQEGSIGKGENLWGLFSGITHYTTHKLKGNADENKLFGIYGNREREVFSDLAQLVS